MDVHGLTDESPEVDCDTDAMYDMICPSVERVDSGFSSGTAASTSAGPSGRRKRKSSDSSVNKKKKEAEERNRKKQQAQEEKKAKKANNDFNKIYKPGECMKHMNVEIHPDLHSLWFVADVSRELSATGASLVVEPSLCDKRLMVWSRNVPKKLTNSDGLVKLSSPKEPCDRGLYVLTADEVAPLVYEHKLSQHMTDVSVISTCRVTLLVFGVKDYFKKSNRKTKNSKEKSMNEIEFEMALTDLLVTTDCDSVVVDTPNELALHVLYFTKAIAEQPYKKAKRAYEDEAEFYMSGDNKNCIQVDKDGNGLNRLWQQMLAILPNSSLETARALCEKYKSPLQLYEALQSSYGVEDLAYVGVARAAVPGSKKRCLGHEFARKLKILFTSDNGKTLVV